MSDAIQRASKKIANFNKLLITKRNNYLDEKIILYKENYLQYNNRYPTEKEEKHYKKSLVMKIGLSFYIPITTLLYLLVMIIRGL